MSDADGSIGSVFCVMASNDVAGDVCAGDSGKCTFNKNNVNKLILNYFCNAVSCYHQWIEMLRQFIFKKIKKAAVC